MSGWANNFYIANEPEGESTKELISVGYNLLSAGANPCKGPCFGPSATDAQGAEGKHKSPGSAAKSGMFQGLKTPELIGVLTPISKQPQQGRYRLRRLPCSSPLQASLPFTPSAPLLPWARQHSQSKGDMSGAGCRLYQPWPQHWSRDIRQAREGAREQRNSCSSRPYSIPHGDGAPQVCLGGTSVQSLCPAARTQHLWRYGGSGLTVFIEETKSNWTKSVSD